MGASGGKAEGLSNNSGREEETAIISRNKQREGKIILAGVAIESPGKTREGKEMENRWGTPKKG